MNAKIGFLSKRAQPIYTYIVVFVAIMGSKNPKKIKQKKNCCKEIYWKSFLWEILRTNHSKIDINYMAHRVAWKRK